FDQRYAAAVQIDGRGFRGVSEAFVQALARVLLQVDAGDTNLLGRAINFDFDHAVLGQWLVILRNLVALGQVGVKIILAGENGGFVDSTLQRHGRQRSELYRFAVQHRQGPRQAQAHRTNIRVGRIPEASGARAEDFGRG